VKSEWRAGVLAMEPEILILDEPTTAWIHPLPQPSYYRELPQAALHYHDTGQLRPATRARFSRGRLWRRATSSIPSGNFTGNRSWSPHAPGHTTMRRLITGRRLLLAETAQQLLSRSIRRAAWSASRASALGARGEPEAASTCWICSSILCLCNGPSRPSARGVVCFAEILHLFLLAVPCISQR
jgi:hypothetical protein